ncbi:MAG TPA: T9SS type A sorting domain-containing protein [Puia sp.]|nr:T9SS type A sorting domain-containing protein [Puia sp.]
MKIKWRLLFVLFIISVLYMHCSAQDTSYQPAKIQTVYIQSEKINVFPNPVTANSDFNIEIDSVRDYFLARILVCNFSDVIVKDEIVKVQKGDNKFQINLSGFEQGNYSVRVISKNGKPFMCSSQLVIR